MNKSGLADIRGCVQVTVKTVKLPFSWILFLPSHTHTHHLYDRMDRGVKMVEQIIEQQRIRYSTFY